MWVIIARCSDLPRGGLPGRLDSYVRDLKQDYSNIWLGGEQINDFLNRLVGFVVSGFEFTVRAMGSMGLLMETAMGQGAAEALVEEQE